jgi:hypothetical protein
MKFSIWHLRNKITNYDIFVFGSIINNNTLQYIKNFYWNRRMINHTLHKKGTSTQAWKITDKMFGRKEWAFLINVIRRKQNIYILKMKFFKILVIFCIVRETILTFLVNILIFLLHAWPRIVTEVESFHHYKCVRKFRYNRLTAIVIKQ